MRIRILTAWLSTLLLVSTGAFAQEEKDIEGGQDHPLVSRMPGFYLSAYQVKDFDSYDPGTLSGPDAKWEGKVTTLKYAIKTGAKNVSMVQIERNYENAVKKLGGKVLASSERTLDTKIQKGGGVTYVHAAAFNDGTSYELVIVESKAMEQEVTTDAAALSQAINATGKAAVYGIYFDTGKAEVKAESAPALKEIEKLLKQNPNLSLYVVGHTDNDGKPEANLRLSTDRASAVVKALVGGGVAAARLKSAGVGPYCPAAENKSADGKAKNRRVELVQSN